MLVNLSSCSLPSVFSLFFLFSSSSNSAYPQDMHSLPCPAGAGRSFRPPHATDDPQGPNANPVSHPSTGQSYSEPDSCKTAAGEAPGTAPPRGPGHCSARVAVPAGANG